MAGDILVNELRSLTRSLASEAGSGLGYGVNNRLIGLGPKPVLGSVYSTLGVLANSENARPAALTPPRLSTGLQRHGRLHNLRWGIEMNKAMEPNDAGSKVASAR